MEDIMSHIRKRFDINKVLGVVCVIAVILVAALAQASEPINEPNCYGYSEHKITVDVYTTAEGHYVVYDYWLKRYMNSGRNFGLPAGTMVEATWKGVDNPDGWNYRAMIGRSELEVPVDLVHEEHPELKNLERYYKDFFIMVMYIGYETTEIHVLSEPNGGRLKKIRAVRMYWAMEGPR